jgi:hypothetical protein
MWHAIGQEDASEKVSKISIPLHVLLHFNYRAARLGMVESIPPVLVEFACILLPGI